MKFQPRYYQSDALSAIFEYFNKEDSTHPIISLPTGSGKSLVQAMLAEKVLADYPECRILFLTHQQELIKQNHAELIGLFDNMFIDAGIYSAGLKSRETGNRIIFAGIQSVYKKAKRLGEFNLVVVDECHSIPKKGEGMYRRFFKDMMEIAPHCKIIGLTATPYRLDSGILTDDFFIEKKDDNGEIIKINMRLFDEIIYNVNVSKLIDQGFLCPLTKKTGVVRPDTSSVKMRGGDFIESELALVCNNAEIIRRAVTEIVALTETRNHVLLFCVSIAHAEAVKEEFISQGADCAVIHSDMPVEVKDQIILDFKDKKIKYVANVNMLTTGFNAKHIDCIALLRPTMSAGLYYQMCGRGLRTLEGKKDCLILDYAGNIGRHGPINQIEIVPKDGKKYGGVSCAPMKYCPACDEAIHISLMVCPECGYEYPVKHNTVAADRDPVSKFVPPVEHEVIDVNYYSHEKKDRVMMRVAYQIGEFESISEYICIEHEGYARQKAQEWLRKALPAGYPIPDTVEQCLELKFSYKTPESIFVNYNEKFPRIVSKIYPEIIEEGKETVTQTIIKNFVR